MFIINKFQCVARLTRDPELTFAQGTGTGITKFGIAINRSFKREGQPEADFFNVTIFGKKAEAVANYTHKGSLISLSGSIQTGSYTDKEGNKKYTTDVIADKVNFLDKKGEGTSNNSSQGSQNSSDYNSDITPIDSTDIPF